MRQTAILLSLLTATSTSFTLHPTFSAHRSLSSLSSSEGGAEAEAEAPSDVESVSGNTELNNSEALRNELLLTAKSLVEESPTGIFLTTPNAKEKFTTAASRLEAITPAMTEQEKDLLVGDWTLVATSSKLTSVDLTTVQENLPFNLKTPPKLNDSIRNSVTVTQRIRSVGDDDESSSTIDRVDNIIQYTPLTLSDLIPENSPLSAIRNWNVNPLEVSQSKVVLVHDATVESVEPTLRTKIGLKSVIVNVAGKSQYLEPSGADIFGLNIPSLGDFANSGSFDSTYVDENVRISRGTIGFLEEVRVFVREGFDMEEILENETTTLEEEENDISNEEAPADDETEQNEEMEEIEESDSNNEENDELIEEEEEETDNEADEDGDETQSKD